MMADIEDLERAIRACAAEPDGVLRDAVEDGVRIGLGLAIQTLDRFVAEEAPKPGEPAPSAMRLARRHAYLAAASAFRELSAGFTFDGPTA